jgi:hypothetical protein
MGGGPVSSGSGIAGWIGATGVVVLMAGAAVAVRLWVSSAADRLQNPQAEKPKVAVADQAEVGYCTPRFKEVLERVLHSCGLASRRCSNACSTPAVSPRTKRVAVASRPT